MVALNTAYAAPKNAADPKNRVGDFFYKDHASVGKNCWASRLNTQEKSCYHYETASGRSNWSNRDPIQEQGGLNLYAMVQNNPIGYWDYLGMQSGRNFSQSVRNNKIAGRQKTTNLLNKSWAATKDAANIAGGMTQMVAGGVAQGLGYAADTVVDAANKYIGGTGNLGSGLKALGDASQALPQTRPLSKPLQAAGNFLENTGTLIDKVAGDGKLEQLGRDAKLDGYNRLLSGLRGDNYNDDQNDNGGGGSDSSGGGGGSPRRDRGDHDGDGVPNYKDDDFNPFEPEGPNVCQ